MTEKTLKKVIEIKKEIDWCDRVLKSDNRNHRNKILGQGSYAENLYNYDTEDIPPWLWSIIIKEIKIRKEKKIKELAEL